MSADHLTTARARARAARRAEQQAALAAFKLAIASAKRDGAYIPPGVTDGLRMPDDEV